jgi:drug/metabolite transporter (DMT)-like permease
MTALLYALFQVLTPLVSRSDSSSVTLAWTIAIGFAAATLLLPFFWQPVAARDWLLMGLGGVVFGTAHGLLIRAFMGAPASLLAPFTYVQIVAAVIFGMIVFGDVPDLWTVVGMALIALAGISVFRRRPVPA